MHTEVTRTHHFEYSHIAAMPSDGDSWQESTSAAGIWAGGLEVLQSQRANKVPRNGIAHTGSTLL